MKIMKKLVKKTLDELAEIMPVLSEKNQHECVGGYAFFNTAGELLGENDLSPSSSYPTDSVFIVSGTDITGINSAISSGTLSTFRPDNDSGFLVNMTGSDKEMFYVYQSRNLVDYDASGVSYINNSYSPTLEYSGTSLIVNTYNMKGYRWGDLQTAFASLSGYDGSGNA